MEILYTTEATSVGGRNGHVKTDDGVIDLEIRTAKSMGGSDDKYSNPEQLFASGYAACYNGATALAGLQRKMKVNPTVKAKVMMVKTEAGDLQLEVEMHVNIPGVDQKTAEELAMAGHQICPYSRAIRGNVNVKTVVIGEE